MTVNESIKLCERERGQDVRGGGKRRKFVGGIAYK